MIICNLPNSESAYRMLSCIYAICHPVTKEVVYIGRSKDFHTRRKGHINNAKKDRYNHNEGLGKWMSEIVKDFGEPIFEIIKVCTWGDLSKWEEHFITKFSCERKLFNIAACGRNNPVYDFQKLKEIAKNNNIKIKDLAAISKSNSGQVSCFLNGDRFGLSKAKSEIVNNYLISIADLGTTLDIVYYQNTPHNDGV